MGLVLRPTWFDARFVLGFTLQVGELHKLIFLYCTEMSGLLPYPWCVNYQCVLQVISIYREMRPHSEISQLEH